MTSRHKGCSRVSRLLFICIATLAIGASVIPAAAASNGKIVFKSGRNGSNGIWAMNPDGTGAASLISNVSFNYDDPVSSPDGSKSPSRRIWQAETRKSL